MTTPDADRTADAEPADAEPADAEPADTEPADAEPAPGRDRFETILLLVVWLLPVLVAAGLLIAVDLAWFAVALVAIEALVGLTVAVVRRRPERAAVPSPHPWVVPAVLIGVLLALLGGTLLLADRG